MSNLLKLFSLVSVSLVVSAKTGWTKEGNVEARGKLVSISASSARVANLSCSINSRTQYRGLLDQPVAASVFSVGDIVKMSCGGGFAKELELEDDRHTGADDSKPNGGGNGKSSTGSELRDRFVDASGVSTNATGSVVYLAKKGGKKPEREFRSTVKLRVPSTFPVTTTRAETRARVLTLTVLRESVAYAQCSFVRDQSSSAALPYVEFKIDIRQKGGVTRVKKGRCDTNLTTDGVQSGIPVAKAGDTLLVQDSEAGVFLEGTL